jgi:spore maturation protein SpmB
LFQKTIIFYIGTLTRLIVGLLWYLKTHPDQIDTISRILSSTIIFAFISFFIYKAIRSKIQAYESFIEGAKGGFQVAINILPYLVAMLCAVALFRSCGALTDLMNGIKFLLLQMGIMTTEFIDALPVILMKPFSGSGARGIMVENMALFGPDSFVSNLSATFQGSTETTFYVLSIYFGSVGISKSRYAASAGLFCDLIGAIAAILIAYLFFK